MSERTQRRLAAIVSADVVGYSRLMGADETGTLAAMREQRAELIDPLIAEHGGRIVKTMGDGLLLEFASAVNAVTCSIAIQEGMADRNSIAAENKRIIFRIGINLGDIIIDGEDIHGDGVNVAARLEGLADPGGVYLSAAIYDQVRDRTDFSFEDLGEHEVKNIERPVHVWRWARDDELPSPAATGAKEPAPLPDKPSIVVLAFDNMSRDPEQEYFSDGISEDIITDLSKVSGLFVIARNSAFSYKGRSFNVPDVCSELGVRYALEGSIRKAGNRVRITAQLVDGTSGGHLWAERYDRELTDIFEVQDEVTEQIVAALKVTLSEKEKSLIGDGGTKNIDAHDAFLKGRDLLFGPKRDRHMFDSATACFRRAIEIDPDYAGPYAGLAMAYMLDHQNHWSEAHETSLDRAARYVSEAIAKDDNDPFAHYVAALVAMWQKDYQRWADEADQALALNPNYALAVSARGIVYTFSGEPTKAIPCIEQAMRLDPAFKHQFIHFLGTAYLVADDYRTAAAQFRERISFNPSTDLSRAFLACALGHLGQADEAHRVWDELMEINPDYSFADHIARLPFRDPSDAEKFSDGLRKAGLPE